MGKSSLNNFNTDLHTHPPGLACDFDELCDHPGHDRQGVDMRAQSSTVGRKGLL